MTISLPAYRKDCEFYRKNLARTDELLYDLCRDHSEHGEQDWVHTKVLLIGRGFASGIERQIPAQEGAGTSIWEVSKLLHKHHHDVDRMMTRLAGINDPLDCLGAKGLQTIVTEHEKLCQLLLKITKKKRARSFASKYLHFHCPLVPMFDWRAYA
ncbi:MAG TPA: hypothetical protein VG013_40670, partial [Gemmataceae bacterium]|nr:hypothetical protein [Gemmataceae bacterium]